MVSLFIISSIEMMYLLPQKHELNTENSVYSTNSSNKLKLTDGIQCNNNIYFPFLSTYFFLIFFTLLSRLNKCVIYIYTRLTELFVSEDGSYFEDIWSQCNGNGTIHTGQDFSFRNTKMKLMN